MVQNREHHVTLPEDRVPPGQKIAAGFGGIYESLTNNGLKQLANPILNIGLGMSPALIGIAMAVPRLFDAVIDPLVGSISDNSQSPWGRRRPFMLIGSFLAAISFVAVWWIPVGASLNFNFWHFLLLSLLFYLGAALFVIPWQALLVEMSNDYHERTRVQAYQSIIGVFGLICLPWLFAATQIPVFPNTLLGVRWVGGGVALILVGAGLVPVFFVRENRSIKSKRRENIPIWKSLSQTARNRPFVILIFILLLYSAGAVMIEGLGLYVNIYYVCGGAVAKASVLQGYSGTIQYLAKFFWVPVMTWLAARHGKRVILALCLGASASADILKWFCYNPRHAYLQLVIPAVSSIGMPSAFVLISSMIADTIDVDRLASGMRREGLYLSVAQWVRKLGITIAYSLSGIILSCTGFDRELGGLQHPETLLWMRILITVVPAAATIAAIVLVGIYPITEERAYEIRRELHFRELNNRDC